MSTFDWDPFKSADNIWRPEAVNDEIVGTITRLEVRKGIGDKDVPVITIDNETEVWASPIDLKSQIAALEPQVGDKLAVRLTGMKHTGQPQPMKLFGVKVKHDERVETLEVFDDEDPF